MRATACHCLFAAVTLAAAARPVQSAPAGTPCEPSSEQCAVVGGWNFGLALGAGARTNPLANGKVLPLVLVPEVSYYGKRFFLDNLDAGITILDTATASLSLVATPGYDRVFFFRSDLQNIFVTPAPGNTAADGSLPPPQPLPRSGRHVTYLAGPEWTVSLHGITAQVDLLHEVTGRNHGNELRAALAVPVTAISPAMTATAGVTWQSAGVVNYYYGAPGIYQPGGVWRPFLKLGYGRPLSARWRLKAFAQYERLGPAIADSPYVSTDHVLTVFAGAVHDF